MMEAKIIKITQFTDKAGQIFRTFKLQHEWDFFWFSELTFNSYSELFTISDNAISFKEPFDQYFLFEKRQNSKGEFLVLLPKKTGNLPPFVNLSVKYDYDVAIPKEKNEDIKSILARAKKITREEFEEEFGMSIDEIPISGRIDNNSSREISDSPSIFGDSSKGNEDASIVQSDPNSDLETEFKEAIKTDDEKQNLPNVPLKRGKINLKDSTTDHSYKVTEDEVSIVSEPVALFEPKSRVIQEDDTTKKPIKLDPEKVKNLFAKITSSELNTKPLIDKTSSLNFDSEKYVIFTESDGLTENDKTDEPKSGLSRAFKIDSDKLFRLPDNPLTAHHDIDKDENKSHSPHDKLSFINGLINLSSKRNIDAKTRERLIGLIGKELGKTGTVENEIMKDVKDIKTLLFEKQEHTQEVQNEKKNSDDKKPPHRPRSTCQFLSNFKYDNDSGFKELVHRPNEKALDTNALLEKVKNHPTLSLYFKKGEKPSFEPINNGIRIAVIELIETFENALINNKNVYPFGANHKYTEKASAFKKNYRFGPFDDAYTCLRLLIEKLAKERINRFPYILEFIPDDNSFDLSATFFAWKPAIEDGLLYIFNEINDNSNIQGNKNFSESKTIKIRAVKDRDREVVDVFIHDMDSIANKDEYEILKSLRKSEPTTKDKFWGLCNWSVFLDNQNGSFELRIISDKISEYSDQPIIKLTGKNDAFIHRLSFYNL